MNVFGDAASFPPLAKEPIISAIQNTLRNNVFYRAAMVELRARRRAQLSALLAEIKDKHFKDADWHPKLEIRMSAE
jgi:hypothetical protein